MFIRFFFIIILLSSCSKSITEHASKPIYENPDSEFEGTSIDFLLDKLIYYYFSIPKEGKKKHNSTIIAALDDPGHGKTYTWKHGDFYGNVKVVITIFEKKDLVCRSWIEEVGRIMAELPNDKVRLKNKVIANKACFSLDKGKWVMTDANFHFSN
jgi:hypothetical protein